jgi:hypothetical protein
MLPSLRKTSSERNVYALGVRSYSRFLYAVGNVLAALLHCGSNAVGVDDIVPAQLGAGLPAANFHNDVLGCHGGRLVYITRRFSPTGGINVTLHVKWNFPQELKNTSHNST